MRRAAWLRRLRHRRDRCPSRYPKTKASTSRSLRPASPASREIMRHRRGGYKLKRDVGSRNSLLKGLVTSIIEQERVITTVPKAKAVKPLVDRMITLAKRDTLHTRRQAAAFLETPASVKKLFETLGARFGQRAGGYTRIVRLGYRKGDGAEQAMIELVGSELVKRAAERAKRREERLKAQREGREPEEGEEQGEEEK